MIYALMKKEVRSMLPFLWLSLAMLVAELVNLLWMPLAVEDFGTSMSTFALGLAMYQIAFGFTLGTGLLVREIDEGTLDFLDALPLTRSAIFVAKFASAMLMLAILPVCLIGLIAFQHLVMNNSLDQELHPGLMGILFGLSMLVAALGVSLGMLLGFLRSLAWLMLFVCVAAISMLQDVAPALSAALNPANLLEPRFTGVSWQFPFVTLWTQLAAGFLFALLAYALFRSSGGVLPRVRKWHKARRFLFLPLVIGLVLVCGAGFVNWARHQQSDKSKADGSQLAGVDFTPAASVQAATRHYTFSYPSTSSARATPFIRRADQTFTDVAALLEIEGGGTIDVDLNGTTNNHAGTAYHSRIRMHIGATRTMDTLAHETAHVFAGRLAGGETGRHLDRMIVLNEGLAEWVESKLSGATDMSEHGFAAAVVSRRSLFKPRDLPDFDKWSLTRDENLKYPLGAIFIDRMIQRYGAAAPKTLLKTLGRPDFPRGLTGYALWQTAFQISGYDLDLVLNDYAGVLKEFGEQHAYTIDNLPRPRGSLAKTSNGYAVKLVMDRELPDGASLEVRFLPGLSSKSSLFLNMPAIPSPKGTMHAVVLKDRIINDKVCFFPGIRYRGVSIRESFTCLPTDSASASLD